MKGKFSMTIAEKNGERRKFDRISTAGRTDAVLFGPDFTKGVQVVDISKGGLSFRYVNGRRPLNGPLELDILWDHLDVFLLKLRIKTVSDFQIANEFLLGVIPIRRCGVEFVDLSPNQASRLDELITKFDPMHG